ncbi:hypothetical protein HanRHA438_Chr01g0019771 [Helianthus annuus]|uniref:Uncharacterized protein n=1 Tax=Helianthus annuus TaxID=4232 RepID=A0A251VN70_HELAN|nr:hypothetical protein HanHA300_Chr01g0015671 [Helianthus annuus]KAJ0622470.1 hypothetical protein HanIR_Chr01g0021071 [Helianthus annuus]KAJ0783072.1 hypothetical protein HanLR1_Chr01g0016221 [Helianthus annuus]KAJ0947771.1 hypothetical protein HanRHA438_Chr01g0019771 [Helianthus annuus]
MTASPPPHFPTLVCYFGLSCDEGFNVGRLKSLIGSDAPNYTAELEEEYISLR